MEQTIQSFKTHGIKVLHNLSLQQLTKLLNDAQKTYYNNTESILLTDDEYDIIKEYTENHFPDYKVPIGALPSSKKVSLPCPMPSMNKIKPDTNAVSQWTQTYRGPYVISAKLDGISALFCKDANNQYKLYTRGNGVIGQDVTHLIPHLFQLPITATSSTSSSIVIRGELVMNRSLFDTKYSSRFANSRNMIAGCVNQKKPDPSIIKDIDFVAYEVLEPECLTAIQQFDFLAQLNVKTVEHRILTSINNSNLSNILVEWRNQYEYSTDGIIVTNNAVAFLSNKDRPNINPDHSFAFKMVLSEQIAEAKVIDVLWSPSKYGLLKPRVQIEPIVLGGVTIEYATAFNAAYVQNNKIGVGAVIELMRSGDVIPHILSVIKSATHAKMPTPITSYEWNKTGVDIVLKNSVENETVQLKSIVSFFQIMSVEGLGEGNVKKIMNAGFTSVAEILAMTPRHFLRVDGFKDKMSNKIYASIQTQVMKNASLIQVMVGSGMFGRGFGEKRASIILEEYPAVLTDETTTAMEKIEKIRQIQGVELITAQQFVEGISPFLEFIKKCRLEHLLVSSTNQGNPTTTNMDKNHPLCGKSIVMTGFRDKDLTEALKRVGCKEVGSVSKNTFAVIIRDAEFSSVKVDAAKEKGIRIYSLDEFKKQYL